MTTPKIAQLRYNEETDRLEHDGYGLHCGDEIEVLIVDGIDGEAKWIRSRIEYGEGEWYVVGLIGYQANGLFAKI